MFTLLQFPVVFAFPFSVLYLDNKCVLLDGFLVAQMFIRVEFLCPHQGWGRGECVALCSSHKQSGCIVNSDWAAVPLQAQGYFVSFGFALPLL